MDHQSRKHCLLDVQHASNCSTLNMFRVFGRFPPKSSVETSNVTPFFAGLPHQRHQKQRRLVPLRLAEWTGHLLSWSTAAQEKPGNRFVSETGQRCGFLGLEWLKRKKSYVVICGECLTKKDGELKLLLFLLGLLESLDDLLWLTWRFLPKRWLIR